MMDTNKRWGNSAMKGHGVNSPAMMQARKAIANKMAKPYKGFKVEIIKMKGGKNEYQVPENNIGRAGSLKEAKNRIDNFRKHNVRSN